jgi:hypothetical protein
VHKYLKSGVCDLNYKWIWKSALPLKIKIFLWQMMQNTVLTRDNLTKRNWGEKPNCSLCNHLEDRNHLFYSCSSARVVWGALGSVLGTNRCPSSFGNPTLGSMRSGLVEISFTLWCLQLFIGPFGLLESR